MLPLILGFSVAAFTSVVTQDPKLIEAPYTREYFCVTCIVLHKFCKILLRAAYIQDFEGHLNL